MNIVSAFVVFIMIWWVVLFCTLPFSVAREQEGLDDPHMAPGAPSAHKLGKKILITTLISLALWVGVYVIIDMDVISFRDMAKE